MWQNTGRHFAQCAQHFLRARTESRMVATALHGSDRPDARVLDTDAYVYVVQHERLVGSVFRAGALSRVRGDPPPWCRPGEPHVPCTRENVMTQIPFKWFSNASMHATARDYTQRDLVLQQFCAYNDIFSPAVELYTCIMLHSVPRCVLCV